MGKALMLSPVSYETPIIVYLQHRFSVSTGSPC